MASNATRYGTLIAGSGIGGFLASVAFGSLVLGGNQYTDRNQNTTPKLSLGTGAYQVYKDAVCTNTGGLAKYTACSIQNPLTGTGVLHRVQLDSNKAPTASPVTCSTSPDGTATGTVLFKYATTASGRSIVNANPKDNSFGSSGSLLVPPSWYVRCWHATTPGPGLKEQLRLWFNEFYVP